jgi:hypothetical protein
MALGEVVHLPRMVAWPGLLVLLLVLVASVVMFRLLVVRWTTRKHWFDLSQWADEHDMVPHPAEQVRLPGPMEQLTAAVADAAFTSKNGAGTTIVSFHTPKNQRTDSSQFTQWHLLVRPMEASWPPTGLRPRANKSSVIDLFGVMTSFPSMAPPVRFVVFGTDSAAARRVAKSSLIALLPPDVGLMLHGTWLVLDFSSRPFDSIELTRVTGLAEQLAGHLPQAPVHQET